MVLPQLHSFLDTPVRELIWGSVKGSIVRDEDGNLFTAFAARAVLARYLPLGASEVAKAVKGWNPSCTVDMEGPRNSFQDILTLGNPFVDVVVERAEGSLFWRTANACREL